MPLRCVDSNTDRSIQSPDLSADEWKTLELANKRARHLAMPCCRSQVTLKTSRRGTRFFAHKAVGECISAPESETHLHLKGLALAAARTHGWHAATEVAGTTPEGDSWIADVLAEKGRHKVAVEIQWSGQTDEETLSRQERYRRSGIRGLWLIRQPGFPVAHKLPAACIGGDLVAGFSALIPGSTRLRASDRNKPEAWHQIVPMSEFLNAVFDCRFLFGLWVDAPLRVSVLSAIVKCWHHSCSAPTRIITGIDISVGPNQWRIEIGEFGEHPSPLKTILSRLPSGQNIGRIKFRYSKTMESSYLSNGCVRCDRIYGQFFEHEGYDSERELINFKVPLSAEWKNAIERNDAYEDSWSVYSAKPGGPMPVTIESSGM